MVKLLISRGAALNQWDQLRRTPLHLACANNHVEVALMLLEAGADIDVTNYWVSGLQYGLCAKP